MTATAGKPLVEGRKVTGFTNTEEEAVGLTKVVPFTFEDELKAQGGIYPRGFDWAPYVGSHGLLITGQKPNLSGPVARTLIEQLVKTAA